MDTLGKLGFVYDVEHVAPNGEIVERQHFHNLMPNEGICWALTKTFAPTTKVPSWGSKHTDITYNDFTYLALSFYKGLFTPSKVFDSMATFPVMADEITTADCDRWKRKEITDHHWGGVTLDTSTNTLHFYKITTPVFLKPTLLTGLFIIAYNYDGGQIEPKSTLGLLVSEAFFPNPIQMEVNGTITVQCGCTLISA